MAATSTLEAIAEAGLTEADERRVIAQVPFSSRRRWSALDLGAERLVLGAPERFATADPALAQRALSARGSASVKPSPVWVRSVRDLERRRLLG